MLNDAWFVDKLPNITVLATVRGLIPSVGELIPAIGELIPGVGSLITGLKGSYLKEVYFKELLRPEMNPVRAGGSGVRRLGLKPKPLKGNKNENHHALLFSSRGFEDVNH